jgi:ketosteroid isomerase-like protein
MWAGFLSAGNGDRACDRGVTRRNHWSASPDRTKKLVNLFASDEYACLEYLTGGTLTGRADFQTVSFEPTGRHYEFQCCFVFRLRDGKIDRVHEYFDLDTARRVTGQLN